MPEDTKPTDEGKQLLIPLHVSYIQSLDTKKDDLEYWMTEHLRLSGVYWGLVALDLMGHIDALPKNDVVEYIASRQAENGGFRGHLRHDPHLLYTLSAVQILVLYDAMDAIDVENVVRYIKQLQDPKDGSFTGDEWGEVDTRFSYCAFSCLSLVGRLDAVDVQKGVDFIASCRNFDGGFGSVPGAESHAGQIFCCVGALAIADSLHLVDVDLLGWRLCERQLRCGGLNGRPEKLEDVCYSWWVLSALSILGRLHWINREKMIEFILACQDSERGNC